MFSGVKAKILLAALGGGGAFLVMDNEDGLMLNEMVDAMPAMQELQAQADAIMKTGISANHMVILVAIIFMGKGFMTILGKITDAGVDHWRASHNQKGDVQ